MKTIGNIKLPLKGVIKHRGNDISALDILFDLHIKEMTTALEYINQRDIPYICVIRSEPNKFDVLLMFKPPEVMTDFKGQKYQLYLAPHVSEISEYFKVIGYESNDPDIRNFTWEIIKHIQVFTKDIKSAHK
jgi:hypothetical protein